LNAACNQVILVFRAFWKKVLSQRRSQALCVIWHQVGCGCGCRQAEWKLYASNFGHAYALIGLEMLVSGPRISYGDSVDIWALGCIAFELTTPSKFIFVCTAANNLFSATVSLRHHHDWLMLRALNC
jgi:hypothetical protein